MGFVWSKQQWRGAPSLFQSHVYFFDFFNPEGGQVFLEIPAKKYNLAFPLIRLIELEKALILWIILSIIIDSLSSALCGLSLNF